MARKSTVATTRLRTPSWHAAERRPSRSRRALPFTRPQSYTRTRITPRERERKARLHRSTQGGNSVEERVALQKEILVCRKRSIKQSKWPAPGEDSPRQRPLLDISYCFAESSLYGVILIYIKIKIKTYFDILAKKPYFNDANGRERIFSPSSILPYRRQTTVERSHFAKDY